MSWQVVAFEGLTGHPDDALRFSFPFVQQHWLPLLDRAFVDFVCHYHSQGRRGVRAAAQAALAAADADAPRSRVIVLGYSNGGHAAIQFAECLAERGLGVRLGFTVDPIPKGLSLLLPARKVLAKPSNAARWVNFYQRTDRGSLAGVIPLRGHAVLGADVNAEVTALGGRGHVRLPCHGEVLTRMAEELGAAGVPARDHHRGC